MTNRYIKYILLPVVLLVVISCSEGFLELSPQQSVSNEEALLVIGDFESSLNAAYNGLSDADYYGRYFILVPDVMSDDVKQHPSANRAKDYAEYSAVVGDGIAEEMWQEMYAEINNLNAVINAEVTLPESVQDEYEHMIGEAHALRGLVYFDLARAFAQHYTFTPDASHLGVPIVLEFDQFNEPQRNSVAEVYNQAISDLQKGIDMMDGSSRSGTTSMLNNTAAKALLARVYLYKEDWANAESLANDVIENGGYSLIPTEGYIDAWVSGGYSSESIFEIAMTEADNRGSDALGRMYIQEGYGDYLPSNDLVSLIPEEDVRFGIFKQDEFLDGIYGPYRMNKYPSVTGEDNTIVIRLSEMYLTRAEARAQQGNNAAQADVDAIRQRGLPSAPSVTATGDELLDEVLLERRKELCFEGHRLMGSNEI